MTTSASDPAVPPAANPSNPFRLRPDPPRVVRLSRKVLGGLAVITTIGIGGALIFALQDRPAQERPGELFTTENRPTADALRRLLSDYSGIPQLGPALPGDLGRPILLTQDTGQPIPASPMPGPDPTEQPRLAEEDGVDHHWGGVLRAALLSTLFNIGGELETDDNDPIATAIRDGAQDTIGDADREIVRRRIDIPPTLTVRPGFPVRVIVTRDLILEPQVGH